MAQENIGLMEAIDIAMDAEKKAKEFYADAAKKVVNERGKNLLTQLADFEQNHYNKLKELKDSLEKSGEFIKYEGTDFKPYKAEISGDLEHSTAEVIDILKLAIDAETKARDHYSKMAKLTSDPAGQEMFEKLSSEEETHRRILNDELYNIANQGGIWGWGD